MKITTTSPPHTAAASLAAMKMHAARSVDNPAKLRKAVLIVRAALERGVLTVDDLAPEK